MGKTADDTPPTDDSAYSCTGDSGFSDSRAFLKELSPPSSPQHTSTQIECALGSGVSYTPLITADVRGAEYYKTLNRESIQGNTLYLTFLYWSHMLTLQRLHMVRIINHPMKINNYLLTQVCNKQPAAKHNSNMMLFL